MNRDTYVLGMESQAQYFNGLTHSGQFGGYNGVYYTYTDKLDCAMKYWDRPTALVVRDMLNAGLGVGSRTRFVIYRVINAPTLIKDNE
jgi:hypothetical protein